MHRVAQLLILATISVFTLAAQRGPGGFDRAPGGGANADPATRITRQVEFLTALLTLTTNQASQGTTIFTNEAAAITPLQTSLNTARESLQTAVKANNTATIDQLSSQIGTLTGQITAAHSKADAAFYALLTADQKTRYDAVGGGHGPGGGPGGRGGR
jgi:Spy/CpxP family protein refolding chaperone